MVVVLRNKQSKNGQSSNDRTVFKIFLSKIFGQKKFEVIELVKLKNGTRTEYWNISICWYENYFIMSILSKIG